MIAELDYSRKNITSVIRVVGRGETELYESRIIKGFAFEKKKNDIINGRYRKT